MRERYKNALMWGLYAALVLLILVLQTVSFGRPRFFGVKLCFVPVLVACVSMHVGSEAGCVFGMACGLVWTLSGADGGAMHIVLLALCGAVAGYLCDRYLVRNLVSALLMSLLCLLFCQLVLFLFKCMVSSIGIPGLLPVLAQVGLSLLLCPPVYLAAWAIRKAGA